jgi:hypothetical protein
VTANSVPAAAVIQRSQALSGFIGRKAFRRWVGKLSFKDHGSTGGRGVILPVLVIDGASGTDGVVVKYVDIIRNSKGEGRMLINQRH